MPLQATSGAASYDAFGGGVPVVPQYIEDVFSTYLYAGNDDTNVITNGIDLSTKGGLVWCKSRTLTTSANHVLFDSARGVNKLIYTNSTSAEITSGGGSGPLSFNTDGFTLQQNASGENRSSSNQVAWTFRKQPKFFDIVTYTGNGTNQTIAHNLGSVPACIMVKSTSLSSQWLIYHSSLANSETLSFTANAKALGSAAWNSTNPTSTVFSVGANNSVNQSGATFVAYVFASDAGGFGLTGTDNVITTSGFTTSASGLATVNLGYEPQWILIKQSASITASYGDWYLIDNMRGWPTDGGDNGTDVSFNPNLINAESLAGFPLNLNSTGFTFSTGDPNWYSKPFIYIAIRRGPMKVPTSGTEVFATVARSGTGSSTALTSPNIVTDMAWIKQRDGYDNPIDATRLIGPTRILFQNSTNAEVTDAQSVTSFASNVGYTVGTGSRVNASGSTYANWVFKRAPSVFDVVCYTGTGSAQTLTHNLGATPELIIIKNRVQAFPWYTYSQTIGATKYLRLNTTDAQATSTNVWNNTAPTSTQFTVGSSGSFASGDGFVAYLFATCAGVSKCGSYTGTGTLTTINCGFTGGARFVMIKRTDSTGPWYIWDTARGMVSGTDPSLMINDGEVEVNANSVYTASTGFQLLASPSVDINTNGGTYIFLAMA